MSGVASRAVPNQRKGPSEDARAKMSAAKRGIPKTTEHKRKIAESVRRWYEAAEDWQKRRGFRQFLSDDEAEDYRFLRTQHHYDVADALRAIGRGDLVEGGARDNAY